MRGPQIKAVLQKPIESRTSTGGISMAWLDVATISGSFTELTAYEQQAYAKETVFATSKLIIMARRIDSRDLQEIKEKNRIVIPENGSGIARREYDIVSVIPRSRSNRRAIFYELLLRTVE